MTGLYFLLGGVLLVAAGEAVFCLFLITNQRGRLMELSVQSVYRRSFIDMVSKPWLESEAFKDAVINLSPEDRPKAKLVSAVWSSYVLLIPDQKSPMDECALTMTLDVSDSSV